MRIRHAEAHRDAAACAGIYGPFVEGTAVSFEESAPDAVALRARIEQVSREHPWLVAEIEGELAGFAYASRHRQRLAYRWAADASVYVAPAHQRRGVGSELYRQLFGLLRGQGLRVVCAGITLPNPGSQALHESLGFQPVGVYRRIGYKHGAWWDVGWWQLELDPPPPGSPPEPGPPARPRH